MGKLNYLLSALLLTVGVIFSWESYARGSLSDLLTQNPSRPESQALARKDLDRKKPPSDELPKGSRVQIPWEELYEKRPPRKDDPTGSRGGACPIAPAVPGKIRVVWSDRPLFLWQGNLGKIEVHPQDSDEVLWSQTSPEPDGSTIYRGKALQPGQSYDVMGFDQRDRLLFEVTFQVLPTKERNPIAADLTRIEAQQRQKKATAEEIAYAKADYFASRQMWADALQEAYRVQNPSPALTKFKQITPRKFCE